MKVNLKCTVVNDIKCFSPNVANSYVDYSYNGFDLTDRNAKSFF